MRGLKLATFWNHPQSLRSIDHIDAGSDLYVHHHLGLGDMIHCNGMVRSLLQRLNSECCVHVFCKERLSAMVRWMYRDEPRIIVEPIDERCKEGQQVRSLLRARRTQNFLSIGHRALRPLEKRYPHLFFDQLFYLQLGLPYEYRFTRCYWKRDEEEEERVFKKLVPKSRPYAFVHDDAQRGFQVDTQHIDLPIVRNDISESIFSLSKLIENAAEIHCMESSIRCMIESLAFAHTKLYYHNFRYPDRPLGTATRLPWKQISYARAA